ncbi:MAG: YfiR family protein [bacterium]|nr:YfiR family protein [bacterium]
MRTIATVASLSVFALGPVWADSYEDRRLRTGARLFRSLLAADQGISEKTGDDDQLLILFFFKGDRREAEILADTAFNQADSQTPVKIRDYPVRVEFIDDPAFQNHQQDIPAGIFLVDSLPEKDLQAIIGFAVDNHVVLFSPHEGHVEKGVLGGLVIEAQVRPHVNLKAARDSEINIKEFFLKVAKVTE